MRTIILFLVLASHAFAFDWQSDVKAGDFTSESDPADSIKIRKDGNLGKRPKIDPLPIRR